MAGTLAVSASLIRESLTKKGVRVRMIAIKATRGFTSEMSAWIIHPSDE
jgi:hypothetical protein